MPKLTEDNVILQNVDQRNFQGYFVLLLQLRQ